MKIDYEYKSYVLNNHADLLRKQKRAKLFEYACALKVNEGIVSFALKTKKEEYQPLFCLEQYAIDNNLKKELEECEKINKAEYERTKRLKKRVSRMLNNGPCIFLTLTFTNDTLAKTTEKQRRVAVSRYLKQFYSMYIANIDYGSKNEREHYHALIQCDKVSFDSWRKYGNINAERVRIKDINTDNAKLSKYIAKLSNHAIKETARRGALIYSR